MNGHYVDKNISKAYYLFEKGANLGDSDAQFNIGSLLIYNETDDIAKEMSTGFKYITLAAQQGHLGALYALAMSYLEGSDFYSTCDTAAKLFSVVVERGEWNVYLKDALELYNKMLYSHANIHYLVSAYIGYEPGIINSGILTEKYKIFDEKKDLDFSDMVYNKKHFGEDVVFRLLRKKGLFGFGEKYLKDLFFDDIQNFLRTAIVEKDQRQIFDEVLFFGKQQEEQKSKEVQDGKLQSKKTEENLKDLVYDMKLKDYNILLSKKLYEEGFVDHNTFAGLRLGDLYYYGKLTFDNKPDYKGAVYYYEKTTETNTSRDTLAQSWHSLGYMHQFGLGVPQNSTLAISYYEDVSFFLITK